MVILRCNTKVVEDQYKDKQVVHAERFLEQVACQKFHSRLLPSPVVDDHIEYQCQDSPERAGPSHFLDFNPMSWAVKNKAIQPQQEEDENVDNNPEVDAVHGSVGAPSR